MADAGRFRMALCSKKRRPVTIAKPYRTLRSEAAKEAGAATLAKKPVLTPKIRVKKIPAKRAENTQDAATSAEDGMNSPIVETSMILNRRETYMEPNTTPKVANRKRKAIKPASPEK